MEICQYNIPMLYCFKSGIREEWKNNDFLMKYSRDKEKPLTVKDIEAEYNKFAAIDLNALKTFADEFLCAEIIDTIDMFKSNPTLNRIPESIFDLVLHPKIDDLFMFANPTWFFNELQKPTAIINFTLKIPAKRRESDEQ